MLAPLAKPVLPPPIQAQLGLRDPRHRPMSTVQTALRDLGQYDIDGDTIRALIESGCLVAFNIAVRLDTKPEHRILTKSIEFFQANQGRKYHELEWPQIFRLIIRHQKPVVTGLEIRRALICDRGHVENLILAKELAPLKKSQSGPGGSWVVSRDSFEGFMKKRML